MSRFRFLLPSLLILALLFSSGSALAQSKSSSKASKSDSKKVGFSGDPARKRGMEIGFDMGKKAGKSDKEQALKPDLKRHEAFQKPEKYYRSEYGSSASFTAGFRSGFSGGYQSAFGKKVNMPSDGTMGTKVPKTPVPKKGSTHASDAL